MFDFDEMINLFLKRERKPRQIGRYYPSEIGGCLRRTWFNYKIPRGEDKDLLKIFEIGNIVHDFVEKVLESDKNHLVNLDKSEEPFKFEIDGFVVSGRIDDLITLKEQGKQVLVEVKSCRNVNSISAPKHENALQLQFYLHVLKMKQGALLYVDKNNLQSKTFSLDYNQEMAEEAIQRFKILNAHLVANKVPFPEAKIDSKLSWMCRYCDYKEDCMKADNKSIL